MKNNNGKIAIAIVAMFVVALSVVGFTYAYFTASITGNSATDSVQVTAGKLEVDYQTSSTITASNIVPGWESDGNSYYDPVHSIQEVAEIGEDGVATGNTIKAVVAVKASEVEETVTPEDYGLVAPADFTIENTGTDVAYYSIVLTDIVNSIAETDQDNFKVTLYESIDNSFDTAEKVVDGTPLNKTGVEQTLIAQTSVAVGETKYYRLVLSYADDGNQNASAGAKAVSAKVEVVGLGQTGA